MLNAFAVVCLCFWVQYMWLTKKDFLIRVQITDHYDTSQGRTRKHLLLHFHQMVIMVSICSLTTLGLGVVSLVIVRNVGLTCCQLLQERGGFCIRFLCFLSNKTSIYWNSCFQIHACRANHLSAGNLVHKDFYITWKEKSKNWGGRGWKKSYHQYKSCYLITDTL